MLDTMSKPRSIAEGDSSAPNQAPDSQEILAKYMVQFGLGMVSRLFLSVSPFLFFSFSIVFTAAYRPFSHLSTSPPRPVA